MFAFRSLIHELAQISQCQVQAHPLVAWIACVLSRWEFISCGAGSRIQEPHCTCSDSCSLRRGVMRTDGLVTVRRPGEALELPDFEYDRISLTDLSAMTRVTFPDEVIWSGN